MKECEIEQIEQSPIDLKFKKLLSGVVSQNSP